MRFSTSFIALAAPFLVSALPYKRAANPTDLLVLKFANVLEQLETQFYSQALSKFQESDFTSAGFTSAQLAVQQFKQIQSDESTHTTVLESTIKSLGDSAISGCNFDFSSVLTDVPTMAAVARVVENVGVGAYLGAAHLVSDPQILTAAASILTVEARHQSILNVLNGGTAIPQAFDTALLPQEVVSIAGGFISGCDVGIPGLPPLKVTNSGAPQPGTSLTFDGPGISGADPSSLSCQMLVGGAPFSISLPFQQCVVPSGINGPVVIWVTNSSQPLANSARDRFTGNIVAGPTMAFIDVQPEELGQLARDPNNSNNGGGALSNPTTSLVANTPSGTSSSDPSATSSAPSAAGAAAATPAAAQDNEPSSPNNAPPGATGLSPKGDLTVNGVTMVPNSK
ncbi:hypothetical protein BD410DRAFT_757878 [Rickenella mellea]|uniref:Ferritin-like domain-containing protein n=1 Tax=Rickenella mellea TaxID=50990 RepID=A0A4R5XDP6_9AGAM|nr:hypothetical protein BD410DRAFT_757878 [Rickenella mellea]